MPKRIAISLLIVWFLSAIFSCDDSSTTPDYPVVYLHNFVSLDSSQYYLIKSQYVEDHSTPEIYLWWEEVIGEPFIDVNENGEYDPGIDIFIMGTGEDNMDLNHDGQWNGPDEPWDPGIPWDDIDGNGTCRQEDYFQSGEGGDNVPFLDVNGNGEFDSDIGYIFGIARPVVALESDTATLWSYDSPDTPLYYLSDSGIAYYPQLYGAHCPVCFGGYSWNGALVIDPEVTCLSYSYDDMTFELLPKTKLHNDTGRVELVGYDSASFFRQISLDETLEIDGEVRRGLLKVRCEEYRFANQNVQALYEGAFVEFYFQNSIGLVCVQGKPEASVAYQRHYFQFMSESPPFRLRK